MALASDTRSESTPESALADREVRDAVAVLPEGLRSLVVLHHIEGRTQGAIARGLGVSKMRVNEKLADARVRLRAMLSSEGDE